MLITQQYRRIRPDELAELLREPEVVLTSYAVGWPEDDDEEAILLEADADEAVFGLDGHGMALHYLLTGEVEGGALPLSNAVLGGTPLGASEHAPRYLTAEEVQEVAQALARMPEDDLEAVFDPADFNAAEVSPRPEPDGWGREDIGPILDAFSRLSAFFKAAAGGGDALLIWRG